MWLDLHEHSPSHHSLISLRMIWWIWRPLPTCWPRQQWGNIPYNHHTFFLSLISWSMSVQPCLSGRTNGKNQSPFSSSSLLRISAFWIMCLSPDFSLCCYQKDKATLQSCILSPSAAHNWFLNSRHEIEHRDLICFCCYFLPCLSHFVVISIFIPFYPFLSYCLILLSNPFLFLSCSDPFSAKTCVFRRFTAQAEVEFGGHFTNVTAN